MLEDVGSKRMVLGGSWGHVLTFWWQACASNPGAGWLAGGLGAQMGAQDGREASEVYPCEAGELGRRASSYKLLFLRL